MKRLLLIIVLLIATGTFAQNQGKVTSALEYQRKLNESYLNPGLSPLLPKDIEDFEGLEFFPLNNRLQVKADFVRTPYEMPVAIPTSTDETEMYVKYGEAYFELNGKEYKLNLYQDQDLKQSQEYKNYLFLPFTDETNGITTYSGGRYIDLEVPKGNKITIDFNKAYNPYCAYNGAFSCPIPPEENHLELKIEAGVKDY